MERKKAKADRKPIDRDRRKSTRVKEEFKEDEALKLVEKEVQDKTPKDKIISRAPVGSLMNNPEWNGVIFELEQAQKVDTLSSD